MEDRLFVRQNMVITTVMIDRGARYLRETHGAGKRLTPWADTPNSVKKKWIALATGVLTAALSSDPA